MNLHINKERVLISIFFILCGISIIAKPKVLSNNSTSIKCAVLTLLGLFLSLLFIYFFRKKLTRNSLLYSNRKSLLAFGVIYIILNLCVYLILYKNYFHNVSPFFIYLFLISSLFICYLFGVKFNDFSWRINIKESILVIIIAVIIVTPELIINGKYRLIYYNQYNGHFSEYLVYSISTFIYPGIYEEFLFRGILISGLKAYNISEVKINIIQALLFGLPHGLLITNLGFKGIFLTGMQILMGYILGKVYFKTKSLTPCIILHGLIDII